jgi:hypothetical protein
MADLSQTRANVALGTTSARVQVGQAGESISQGMPIYKSTSDSKWYQADANASATTAAATATSLTPASTNGYFVYSSEVNALINLGATLTEGETYIVSRTKGAICPIGDATTGDFVRILGQAETTALLRTSYTGGTTAK